MAVEMDICDFYLENVVYLEATSFHNKYIFMTRVIHIFHLVLLINFYSFAQSGVSVIPNFIFADNTNICVTIQFGNINQMDKIKDGSEIYEAAKKIIQEKLEGLGIKPKCYNLSNSLMPDAEFEKEKKRNNINTAIYFSILKFPKKAPFEIDDFQKVLMGISSVGDEKEVSGFKVPKTNYWVGGNMSHSTLQAAFESFKNDIESAPEGYFIRDNSPQERSETAYELFPINSDTVWTWPEDLPTQKLLIYEMEMVDGYEFKDEKGKEKFKEVVEKYYPFEYFFCKKVEISKYKKEGVKYALTYTKEKVPCSEKSNQTIGGTTVNTQKQTTCIVVDMYIKDLETGKNYFYSRSGKRDIDRKILDHQHDTVTSSLVFFCKSVKGYFKK